MESPAGDGVTRREALGLLAGLGATAALGAGCSAASGESGAPAIAASAGAAAPGAGGGAASGAGPESAAGRKEAPGARLPVVYLPHGGGPWPFVDLGFDRAELDSLAAYLRSVPSAVKSPVRALLVVSAHWEEAVPTVMGSARPPMLYDYYGFPPESYTITWPAPGDPALAARVRSLLGGAGFDTATDDARGFDHGTFVPLKVAWPDAAVPTVQLSLVRGLDPAAHVAMGRALAPLRDEGVLILGSGMSYHNLRGFRDPRGRPGAAAFDAWLQAAVVAPQQEREQRLVRWAEAPSARDVHPREEHLLPLMVVAGAAGADRGTVPFSGTLMGMRHSAAHFG